MPRGEVLEAWGESAHSALRWSFGVLSQSVVLPTVLDSYLRADRTPGSITRMEAVAQAAIIKETALGNDPLHRSYLICYYLPTPTRERDAGGGLCWADRAYEERVAAVNVVAWWLMGMDGTGAKRLRGYRELVMQYVMRRPSLRRLRKALKIEFKETIPAKNRAYERLDGLHELALERARRRLIAAQLLDE